MTFTSQSHSPAGDFGNRHVPTQPSEEQFADDGMGENGCITRTPFAPRRPWRPAKSRDSSSYNNGFYGNDQKPSYSLINAQYEDDQLEREQQLQKKVDLELASHHKMEGFMHELEKENIGLKAQLKDLTNENKELKNKLQDQDLYGKEYTQMQRELSDALMNLDSAQAKIAREEANGKRLTMELTNTAKEYQILADNSKNERDNLLAKINAIEKERDEYITECNELREISELFQLEMENLRKEKEEWVQKEHELQLKVDAKEQQLEDNKQMLWEISSQTKGSTPMSLAEEMIAFSNATNRKLSPRLAPSATNSQPINGGLMDKGVNIDLSPAMHRRADVILQRKLEDVTNQLKIQGDIANQEAEIANDKIHRLDRELKQANEKIERLTGELKDVSGFINPITGQLDRNKYTQKSLERLEKELQEQKEINSRIKKQLEDTSKHMTHNNQNSIGERPSIMSLELQLEEQKLEYKNMLASKNKEIEISKAEGETQCTIMKKKLKLLEDFAWNIESERDDLKEKVASLVKASLSHDPTDNISISRPSSFPIGTLQSGMGPSANKIFGNNEFTNEEAGTSGHMYGKLNTKCRDCAIGLKHIEALQKKCEDHVKLQREREQLLMQLNEQENRTKKAIRVVWKERENLQQGVDVLCASGGSSSHAILQLALTMDRVCGEIAQLARDVVGDKRKVCPLKMYEQVLAFVKQQEKPDHRGFLLLIAVPIVVALGISFMKHKIILRSFVPV